MEKVKFYINSSCNSLNLYKNSLFIHCVNGSIY